MVNYSAKVALLSNTIDYAGTFPPAKLPLSQALAKAASFRSTGRHPWLLGRVVLPLKTLAELKVETFFEAGADGSPWNFSALASQTDVSDFESCRKLWEKEFAIIHHFNLGRQTTGFRQSILAYETKSFESLVREKESAVWIEWIQALREVLDFGWESVVSPLCYLEISPQPESAVDHFAAALQPLRDRVGIKVRTGGEGRPSPKLLAGVIYHCAKNSLKFKATQGLHHPVTQTSSFGFVNLFGALTLAYGLGGDRFGKEHIERCLIDTNPSSFRFEKERFSWDQFEMHRGSVGAARAVHQGCFGSCSIDEPDEFLHETFGTEG